MSNFKSSRKVLFAHDGPLFTDGNDFFGIHLTDNLKNRYLQLGDEVTFIIRTKNLDTEDINSYSKISKNNFNVISVPNHKTLLKYFTVRPQVKKIVEKAVKDHDVVVARLPSGVGNIAVHFAVKHNKPLLCELVACTWDALWNYNWKGKLAAPYFFFRQKRRVKKLPYVIYVSKEFLQRRYPTQGLNIHCSNVELSNNSPDILQKRLAHIQYKDIKSPLILSTIAALNVPYKGQADVIKALALLKKKGSLFRYKLVGSGSPARLVKLINKLDMQKEIDIIGPIRHEDVFSFIDQTDVYIQPSKQEGLPRAVIEAMSRACPVIGSNAGGIPELISSEYIFTKGSSKQIAELLSEIDKKSLKKMAQENFESAKNYIPEVLHKRRNDFYELFLKENFPNERN